MQGVVLRELGGPEVLREAAAAHRLMEQDDMCGKIILDPTLG